MLWRKIPYTVALKNKPGSWVSLLNPSSAEPLVWSSPLKFISEINAEEKAMLEQALMEANRKKGKNIFKGRAYLLPSRSYSDTEIDDNSSKVIYSLSSLELLFLPCLIEWQEKSWENLIFAQAKKSCFRIYLIKNMDRKSI